MCHALGWAQETDMLSKTDKVCASTELTLQCGDMEGFVCHARQCRARVGPHVP